jgi:hypothetical protein
MAQKPNNGAVPLDRSAHGCAFRIGGGGADADHVLSHQQKPP